MVRTPISVGSAPPVTLGNVPQLWYPHKRVWRGQKASCTLKPEKWEKLQGQSKRPENWHPSGAPLQVRKVGSGETSVEPGGTPLVSLPGGTGLLCPSSIQLNT